MDAYAGRYRIRRRSSVDGMGFYRQAAAILSETGREELIAFVSYQ
jgi:hypothetical protein